MSKRPEPQPGVLTIAPYVPGRAGTDDGQRAIKLSSNESPLGASPKAVAALAALGEQLADYPEGSSAALRQTLAKVHGLEAERIVIGAGSDEILHMLAQAYLGEGDETVISQFGFLVYPIVTAAAGATAIYADDKDYTVDVDAMLAAVSPRTKVVFLANPNNPTGTMISSVELRRLHAGLPSNVLFVVDSAYAEYVTDPSFEDGAALVREADNVVMVRTFSKMGLAALRIGWLYGPDHIVDAVNRVRGPFNVNLAAQMAGVAAAEDAAFNATLKAHNAKWRDWLSAELSSNAMRVLPSQGNFVLVLFADNDAASRANQALLATGLVVREMGGYGIANGLRISIGTEEAMRGVATVLNGL